MLRFVKNSFVYHTHPTYKDVKRYWNKSVHEFYGLKASQISKVHATSYMYVKKIKNFHNDFEQNFKGEAKNKLKSYVKYPDFLICFHCVQ